MSPQRGTPARKAARYVHHMEAVDRPTLLFSMSRFLEIWCGQSWSRVSGMQAGHNCCTCVGGSAWYWPRPPIENLSNTRTQAQRHHLKLLASRTPAVVLPVPLQPVDQVSTAQLLHDQAHARPGSFGSWLKSQCQDWATQGTHNCSAEQTCKTTQEGYTYASAGMQKQLACLYMS